MVDPDRAPLFLLSRIAGIGRSGAGIIGGSRSNEPIGSWERLTDLWGDRPRPDRSMIRFPGGARTVRVRTRLNQRDGSGTGSWIEAEGAAGSYGARFLAERDAGEGRWDDFRSIGVSWERKGGPRSVVAGDLSARLGTGLLLGTSEPFGPPSGTGGFRSSRLGLYKSRTESAAHRGIGIRIRTNSSDYLLILTDSRRDARVDDRGLVSSIDAGGYHRNESESSRKDRLREQIAGVHLERTRGTVGLGVTAVTARYSPGLGGGDRDRKPDAFTGDALGGLGLSVHRKGRRGAIGVDMGRTTGGGTALRGMAGFRRAGTSIAIRVREYSRSFHAPRGTTYHRLRSEPTGERGVVLIGERKLGRAGRLDIRFHRYRSLGRTWNSPSGVVGEEWSLRAGRRTGARDLYVRISGEDKMESRRGVIGVGARRSLTAGLWFGARRQRRAGLDVRLIAKRGNGDSGQTVGGGAALGFRSPHLDFSWAWARSPGAPIALPAPSLPGSFPIEWYGGSRKAGGWRLVYRGPRQTAVHWSVLAGPGRFALEISMRHES